MTDRHPALQCPDHMPEDKRMRGPINVLSECADLMEKKARDYNSGKIQHADYYRRGLDTILDLCYAKILRIISCREQLDDPNFESIEDSFKDLINYAAYAIAHMRQELDGQKKEIEK